MNLAPNEEIIKEWKYAKVKKRTETVEHSITVTNKRVISGAHGGLTNAQQEIALSDVCAVETGTSKESLKPAIFFFVLGGIMLILAFFLLSRTSTSAGVMLDSSSCIITFFAAGVSVLNGIIFLLKAGCKVEIRIYTTTLITPLLYVTQNSFNNKGVAKSVMRLKVDKAVAEELVEELGMVLLVR